ncbi:hypothetical protein [Carboxydothermus ferrireducens]|uniref:Uncharacterized protein n=1 Tax=Carboxydothermus ferrireducens DSM 11255 TaxID=1119529 RepID=A0ABX2R9C4_9THEO|nr:hypothetical protein [Carboxydothermus ferrireducens]NYE56741.1 hypothetical protein [Carboxydothermus ferrireducens DSM 11255]
MERIAKINKKRTTFKRVRHYSIEETSAISPRERAKRIIERYRPVFDELAKR